MIITFSFLDISCVFKATGRPLATSIKQKLSQYPCNSLPLVLINQNGVTWLPYLLRREVRKPGTGLLASQLRCTVTIPTEPGFCQQENKGNGFWIGNQKRLPQAICREIVIATYSGKNGCKKISKIWEQLSNLRYNYQMEYSNCCKQAH